MNTNQRSGTVFNIQRYSVHDGPGIRTTVFLKGCPLRCRWCHNPEGIDPLPVVSILTEKCIGCEQCATVCPSHLTERLDRPLASQPSVTRCARCGVCAEACPAEARTMVGRSYAASELMDEVVRDRVFYEESGGGVTFSGGEPLAPGNLDFLRCCLIEAREIGLHRTVDTTGYTARENLLEIADEIDLFLYDLKLMNDAAHREYVGVSNRTILDNLRSLSEAGHTIWIRVPLIPGITDTDENLKEIGEFVSSLPNRHPLHLLPYHRVGGDKYRRLRETYQMEGTPAPTEDILCAAATSLQSRGLQVCIGG